MDNEPSKRSAAGGFLIATGAMIGAFAGAAFGESTRGFLIGTATGIVLAAILWWRNR